MELLLTDAAGPPLAAMVDRMAALQMVMDTTGSMIMKGRNPETDKFSPFGDKNVQQAPTGVPLRRMLSVVTADLRARARGEFGSRRAR